MGRQGPGERTVGGEDKLAAQGGDVVNDVQNNLVPTQEHEERPGNVPDGKSEVHLERIQIHMFVIFREDTYGGGFSMVPEYLEY